MNNTFLASLFIMFMSVIVVIIYYVTVNSKKKPSIPDDDDDVDPITVDGCKEGENTDCKVSYGTCGVMCLRPTIIDTPQCGTGKVCETLAPISCDPGEDLCPEAGSSLEDDLAADTGIVLRIPLPGGYIDVDVDAILAKFNFAIDILRGLFSDPEFYLFVGLDIMKEVMVKIILVGYEKALGKTLVKAGRILIKRPIAYIARIVARLGTTALTKLGFRIGAKAAAKIGTKIGVKLGAKMAVGMGLKVGLGPIGWALLAFDLINLAIDIWDPAGYGEAPDKEVFNTVRDELHEGLLDVLADAELGQYEDERKQAQLDRADVIPQIPPIGFIRSRLSIPIFGPLSDMDEDVYLDLVEDNMAINLEVFMLELEPKIKEAIMNNLFQTDEDIDIWLSGILTPEVIDGIATRTTDGVCIQSGGKVVGEACSWKTRAQCDQSIDDLGGWDKIVADMDDDDVEDPLFYRQWVKDYKLDGASSGEGACVISQNHVVRRMCEEGDFKYDYENGTCIITEEDCLEKALEYKDGNCILSDGQNVAEMLFGKTLTRSIIQTFSMDQYNDCKSGYNDEGYFCRKSSCSGTNSDKNGELCYPKCKSDFNGQGPVCWADCPDSGSGCNKHVPFFAKWSYVRTTIPKATCPAGWNTVQAGKISSCNQWRSGFLGLPYLKTSQAKLSCKDTGNYKDSNGKVKGGLCVHNCKDGYKSDPLGAVCYSECPSNTTNTGALCNKNSYGRGFGTIPNIHIYGKTRKVDYSSK